MMRIKKDSNTIDEVESDEEYFLIIVKKDGELTAEKGQILEKRQTDPGATHGTLQDTNFIDTREQSEIAAEHRFKAHLFQNEPNLETRYKNIEQNINLLNSDPTKDDPETGQYRKLLANKKRETNQILLDAKKQYAEHMKEVSRIKNNQKNNSAFDQVAQLHTSIRAISTAIQSLSTTIALSNSAIPTAAATLEKYENEATSQHYTDTMEVKMEASNYCLFLLKEKLATEQGELKKLLDTTAQTQFQDMQLENIKNLNERLEQIAQKLQTLTTSADVGETLLTEAVRALLCTLQKQTDNTISAAQQEFEIFSQSLTSLSLEQQIEKLTARALQISSATTTEQQAHYQTLVTKELTQQKAELKSKRLFEAQGFKDEPELNKRLEKIETALKTASESAIKEEANKESYLTLLRNTQTETQKILAEQAEATRLARERLDAETRRLAAST